MSEYPYSYQAAANLQRNRDMLAEVIGHQPGYTPPSPGHYWGLYRWDQAFMSITDARHGSDRSIEAAMQGINTMLVGQRQDGFIPNLQTLDSPKRRIEPERVLAFDSAEHSNYTQPPLEAQAVLEIYRAKERRPLFEKHRISPRVDSFVRGIFPKLKQTYDYFDEVRSNGPDDKLIGVIHPHETGRDSGPEWDALVKPYRLPRSGPDTPLKTDKANIGLDYLQILAFGRRLKKAGPDINKAREVFWVNDVMTNAIYASNLYDMAELARITESPEDEQRYSERAKQVEAEILDRMWYTNAKQGDGAFYALDRHGMPIIETTVSNLSPVLLPSLKPEQLDSILTLIEGSFSAPRGLPSVATDSPNYDPHNHESDRLWRGPVWINAAWLIAEGLSKQLGRPELANRPELIRRAGESLTKLAVDSLTLVKQPDSEGPREFYDPETGAGQRRRVTRFGWSNLGFVMPPTPKPQNKDS